MLGRPIGDTEIESTIDRLKGDLVVTQTADPARDAAALLNQGRLVAWFDGRSELGPRALGSRSILADPRRPDAWQRTNDAKRREAWQHDWFSMCPAPTPFMLFTGQVCSADLPAITHVDGSARVQSVAPDCGKFRQLLEVFDALTGCPVLLNTSLNGPGEPIIDRHRRYVPRR